MEKHCVRDTYTIMELIESFQQNHDRAAMVLNSDDKLIGVVSQGDVIRALCNGNTLYVNVKKIIRSDFLYLNERDMETAYKLFKKEKITMLPVVDESFLLKDVITLDNIYEYLEKRGSAE